MFMLALPMTLLALVLTWLVWRALNRTNLNIWVKTVLILVTAVVSITGLSMLGIFVVLSSLAG